MYGIDISSYQDKIDLKNGANYEFAIIKATEGIGFKDRSFDKFSVQLTELGKLVGCYHFARPDLNGTVTGMEKEADWFIETVSKAGLLGNAILVLDWETEPMDRPDLIEAWINRVKKTGATPFIYGSKSKLTKWMGYQVVGDSPLWMAAWPSIARLKVGEDPGYKTEPRSIPWLIWQYSSTGLYPKFGGNVDLDFADISTYEWLKYAGCVDDNWTVENINSDMKWAIDNGLFIGGEDGLYHPNDPLTRDGAATVLRRFKEKFIK